MKSQYIHDGWTYRHLDTQEAWVPVTVPHDAMIGEKRGPLSAGGINTGWFEGYDYEYVRPLELGEAQAGRTLVLEFEGVYHNAEVWVNGAKAAYRPYGYTNFYVPLAGLVHAGANEIRVIARNADQPNSRWYSGAGIYRPVALWEGPARHIALNGIRVDTVSTSPAVVRVTVRTEGEGGGSQPVHIEVCDGGTVVASHTGAAAGQEYSCELTVPNAVLWNTEHPRLYVCRVSYGSGAEADVAQTAFGIRTVSYGENGLLLNGRRVIIRGACIHHDNGPLGAACLPEAVERKVRILAANGYNALRSAHNPCSKTLLDVCDRMGILVMDEYIDHWYIHKTEHDYVDYFNDWWRQDLTDMVEKDYNHPCVILYSTGNEVSETAQPRGVALTRELTDFLHSLDATRPVTCGVNIFFNFLSSIGFGVYSDKKAAKEAEAAAKRRAQGQQAKKKKAVGSQFFNDLAGLLGANFMKTGATLHGCDVRTRDAFAAMDIAGYNYGIKRYRHDLRKYPRRLILGSETFCSDAYAFWELAKHEPRLVGDFVWAGMDYIGEVGVGAWEYADYAPEFEHGAGWLTAGSGRIDITGKPLAEAAYTRVAFEVEDGPVIAVVPPSHYKQKHSPSSWKMTDAMESWSFAGCDGATTSVEVYGRGSYVELEINGEKVGTKRFDGDCRVRFTCPYRSGSIKAVLYDASGMAVGQKELRTAGEQTELRAEPERDSVAAGGLAYVRLRYTDADGELKPLERGSVSVAVEGGTLLGLANAGSYNEEGYCGSTTRTYYGEALAVVRAGAAGQLVVRASDGTHTASAAITVG